MTSSSARETFTASAVARVRASGASSALSGGGATLGVGAIAPSIGFAAPSVAKDSPGMLAICKSLLAGGIAGGVSRTAVAPLERLKILQQVAGSTTTAYNGVWSGLSHIWRTEGVAGMFKGNGANCIRIVPNSASKFLAYEYFEGAILKRARESDPDAQLGPLTRLAAGAGRRHLRHVRHLPP